MKTNLEKKVSLKLLGLLSIVLILVLSSCNNILDDVSSLRIGVGDDITGLVVNEILSKNNIDELSNNTLTNSSLQTFEFQDC